MDELALALGLTDTAVRPCAPRRPEVKQKGKADRRMFLVVRQGAHSSEIASGSRTVPLPVGPAMCGPPPPQLRFPRRGAPPTSG